MGSGAVFTVPSVHVFSNANRRKKAPDPISVLEPRYANPLWNPQLLSVIDGNVLVLHSGCMPVVKTAVSGTAVSRELRRLRREVDILRGGLVSVIGEDPEGQYRPEFVARILEAAGEQPMRRFTSAAAFRAALRRA